METISIIPENFVVLLSHPSSLFLPNCSSQFLILSLFVLGRHINKIIRCVPFCVWLLLLKMFLKFVLLHVQIPFASDNKTCTLTTK